MNNYLSKILAGFSWEGWKPEHQGKRAVFKTLKKSIMKIFKCWIVGYPLLKIPSPKKYEIYLFIFLQEERDEIDEINAGDHDNMTYEVPLLFYPGRILRGRPEGGGDVEMITPSPCRLDESKFDLHASNII